MDQRPGWRTKHLSRIASKLTKQQGQLKKGREKENSTPELSQHQPVIYTHENLRKCGEGRNDSLGAPMKIEPPPLRAARDGGVQIQFANDVDSGARGDMRRRG